MEKPRRAEKPTLNFEWASSVQAANQGALGLAVLDYVAVIAAQRHFPTHVISTMMHKMISPALLFPPLLQAYYPLTETTTKLMREKKTPTGKGEIV